jgi:hypothetical protein
MINPESFKLPSIERESLGPLSIFPFSSLNYIHRAKYFPNLASGRHPPYRWYYQLSSLIAAPRSGEERRRGSLLSRLAATKRAERGGEGRDFSLRRPTHSQERMRKKKSACSVRNDVGRERQKADSSLRSE